MDDRKLIGDIESSGQTWNVLWYPPSVAPAGKCHGAAGICVTPQGEVVLISTDGTLWGLPAGRPESKEDWRDTLRREMHEEACVTVIVERLLGFCVSRCIKGPQTGVVLVRSFWLAQVSVDAWDPQFEIARRRMVSVNDVWSHMDQTYMPVYRHAFALAQLASAHSEVSSQSGGPYGAA